MNLERRQWTLALAGAAALGSALPARVGATAASLRLALPSALPRGCEDCVDPSRYLVSEKFDGARAVWDGHVLRHRSGRQVVAPAWFTERLPSQPLDGELWLGRGRFEALMSALRSERHIDEHWRGIRYLLFELPGSSGTFVDRAAAIERIVAVTGWPSLQAVAQTRAVDREALRHRFDAVVRGGGEGLVLHRADAPYVTGRTDALLKLKPALDAEAVVVGYRPGRGRYRGDTGALEVETPRGRRFFLGSGLSDALRRAPPPRGSIVTYRYRDLTASGLPRFASFMRLHPAL